MASIPPSDFTSPNPEIAPSQNYFPSSSQVHFPCRLTLAPGALLEKVTRLCLRCSALEYLEEAPTSESPGKWWSHSYEVYNPSKGIDYFESQSGLSISFPRKILNLMPPCLPSIQVVADFQTTRGDVRCRHIQGKLSEPYLLPQEMFRIIDSYSSDMGPVEDKDTTSRPLFITLKHLGPSQRKTHKWTLQALTATVEIEE